MYPSGRLRRAYESRYPSLEAYTVDRSIYRDKRYGPIALVQFGRGCRYACDFCSIHAFYGSNRRWRSIPSVIDEIRQLPRKFVFFVDVVLVNHGPGTEDLPSNLPPSGPETA